MTVPDWHVVNAVRDLIARFDDAINRRDMHTFHGLWTADAVWDIRTMSTSTGPDAITATIAGMLDNWEVFFQLSGEAVIESDGDQVLARSPMWEFGRSHGGQSYSGYALNADRFVTGANGWRFARRTWYPMLVNQADIPGNAIALPEEVRP